MKIRIEYCVRWNYEPRALRARDILVRRYGSEAEVELVKGDGGVFEITVDGRLAFSKKALGRFPSDDEIAAIGGGW